MRFTEEKKWVFKNSNSTKKPNENKKKKGQIERIRRQKNKREKRDNE